MIEPAAKVGLYRTGFQKKYRLALPPRPLKYFFSPKNHPKCEGWVKSVHSMAIRDRSVWRAPDGDGAPRFGWSIAPSYLNFAGFLTRDMNGYKHASVAACWS